MNATSSQKFMVRLWAAVSCDFESLIAKYIGNSGWRYAHFAKVCREMQITLIMHITQGRGKNKDEHYYRVVNIILQEAKKLWLTSKRETVTGRVKTSGDKDLELKRSIGGFFLLYTMFEKQPIKDKVKIAVGIEDLRAITRFCDEYIKELPFRGEILFIMKFLWHKEAFHYCIYPEDFRFDAASRLFLNYSKSEIVDLTGRMRDVQDALAYSSIYREAETHFTDMTIEKNTLVREILKTSDTDVLMSHMDDNAQGFSKLVKTVSSSNLVNALSKIDDVVDKPVITLPVLTTTEAIEKRMVIETRLRMERARKKALQTLVRDEHKAAHPYVREGGIFGRKKETDEDNKCKRRERGACNGNLWIYIHGYDFDKPMDNDPIPDPPTNFNGAKN